MNGSPAEQELLREIESTLQNTIGTGAKIKSVEPVSGGCISDAKILTLDNGERFFAKTSSRYPHMFAAESMGLSAIAQTDTIGVPRVVANGITGAGIGFLILEMIETSRPTGRFMEEFGRLMAVFHQSGGAERFGFESDNFIGATQQPNDWNENWIEFWREQRLGVQLRLARDNGLVDSVFCKYLENLMSRLDLWLSHDERPCLIHGDLWSGNYLVAGDGTPVLIDPAVYYGSREAEFGMTTLFGGFDQGFYDAYDATWPLATGWQRRVEIYKLYHLLNHLNLFGKSYLHPCMDLLKKLA